MSTFSLVVELIVLGLIIIGFILKREQKYRQHGIFMTTAFALHLIPIFTWMVWSFINYFNYASANLSSLLVQATFVHVILGITAASLGIWLIATWHLQADVQKCFSRKRIMLIALTLWSTAIILGMVLYIAVVLS
jgi:uncharacterized membrane protein YozB (DUF420 family)